MKNMDSKLNDVAVQIGVPYQTAARWIQQGLIKPPRYRKQQGAPVRLTAKDVRELHILARLRGLLSLQELRKAMRYLRNELKEKPLSKDRFFVLGGPPKGRQVIKICDTSEAIGIIGKNQGQLMIPLCFKEN